jgi:hypothetical protein
MPKGVFDRGPMMARRAALKAATQGKSVYHKPMQEEDEASIHNRIEERFMILERLSSSVIAGLSKAIIISGPPGLGKSYSIEKQLEQYDPEGDRYIISKGFIRPSSLYTLLYQYRHKGNILVFDDSDSVFLDEVSLNLLKAACDTTEERHVSYRSESIKTTDDGQLVPKSFEFEGSVIFITNYDFDKMIEQGSKLAPHFNALMSRAHYVNLGMSNRRDYLVRVKQVMATGLFDQYDNKRLPLHMQHEVISYMKDNLEVLREVSIRMAVKIAILAKANSDDWQHMADVTCIKQS